MASVVTRNLEEARVLLAFGRQLSLPGLVASNVPIGRAPGRNQKSDEGEEHKSPRQEQRQSKRAEISGQGESVAQA
jgi:hypothetical protein